MQNTAQRGGGPYSTGANTIDFRNNSTLTVEQGASVISARTEGNAEAVNPEGTGNTIANNGTIKGVNSAAIWFQNTTGSNTVINNATGVIQAPGNVMGASGNGAVDFTNRGKVIGKVLVQTGGEAETFPIYKDALFIERDGIPDGRYSSILEPESAEIELALADAVHQLDA